MPANNGNIVSKVLLVLVLLGAGAYAVRAGFRETAIVAEVQRGIAVDAVPGSVVVHADKDLQELKIEGSGRVVECSRLDVGASFSKGDVLVRLDTTELDRGFAEAKRRYEGEREILRIRTERNTDLAVAKQNLDNVRRLHELGNASTDNVNAAQRVLDAILTAQAEVDFNSRREAEAFARLAEAHELQLRKMTVVAPAAGIVEAVRVNVGTLVSGGATVATFYANERVVLAKISEEDIAKVKLGDPAKVQLLTFPGKNFPARVVKTLPFADAETRRYSVFLDVQAEPGQLLPNSTGEVTITVGTHANVPLVPRRAIFNGSVVYVVKDGRVERRLIEVGYRGLIEAEVTKGLAVGEVVIVEDLDQFRAGQRVSAARNP